MAGFGILSAAAAHGGAPVLANLGGTIRVAAQQQVVRNATAAALAGNHGLVTKVAPTAYQAEAAADSDEDISLDGLDAF